MDSSVLAAVWRKKNKQIASASAQQGVILGTAGC